MNWRGRVKYLYTSQLTLHKSLILYQFNLHSLWSSLELDDQSRTILHINVNLKYRVSQKKFCFVRLQKQNKAKFFLEHPVGQTKPKLLRLVYLLNIKQSSLNMIADVTDHNRTPGIKILPQHHWTEYWQEQAEQLRCCGDKHFFWSVLCPMMLLQYSDTWTSVAILFNDDCFIFDR